MKNLILSLLTIVLMVPTHYANAGVQKVSLNYLFADTEKAVVYSYVKTKNLNDTFYVRKVIRDSNSLFSTQTQWVKAVGTSFFNDSLRPPLVKVGVLYFLKIEVMEDTAGINVSTSSVGTFRIKPIIYPPTINIIYDDKIRGKIIVKVNYTLGGCDSAKIKWTVSMFKDSTVYSGDSVVFYDSNIIDTISFPKLTQRETFKFEYYIQTYCGEYNGGMFYFEVKPNASISIRENKKMKTKIYPNPVTTNYFFVEIPNLKDLNEKQNFVFQLFDITGKMVIEETLLNPKTQIRVPRLHRGVFITNTGDKIIIR